MAVRCAASTAVVLVTPAGRHATRIGVSVATAFAFSVAWGAADSVGARSAGAISSQDIEEVRVAIRGAGRVLSIPAGIECHGSCEHEFRAGTDVMLVAGSRPESRFVGWTGDCVGRSVLCVLVADRPVRVTARFEPDPDPDIGLAPHASYSINVTGPRAGRGGTIKSERPAVGIDCPRKCSKKFLNRTRVTLRAYASTGYAPVWQSYPTGLCRGDRCSVVLTGADVHVGAAFRRRR